MKSVAIVPTVAIGIGIVALLVSLESGQQSRVRTGAGSPIPTRQGVESCPQPPAYTSTADGGIQTTLSGGTTCTDNTCSSHERAMASTARAADQQALACDDYTTDLANQGQFVTDNCGPAYRAQLALEQCTATNPSEPSACSTQRAEADCYSHAIQAAVNRETQDETHAATINRPCAGVNAAAAACQFQNCVSDCEDAGPAIDCCGSERAVADLTDCCMDGRDTQEVDCDVNTGAVITSPVSECSSTCTIAGC